MIKHVFTIVLAAGALGFAACEKNPTSPTTTNTPPRVITPNTSPSTTPSATPTSPSTRGDTNPANTQPDNTARNKTDRDGDTKTPMDQSDSNADVKTTAEIRRAVMADDSLSTDAKNCKIILDKGGVVTLRGPVKSQAEKDSIEAKAKAVVGVTRVDNQLEVKPG